MSPDVLEQRRLEVDPEGGSLLLTLLGILEEHNHSELVTESHGSNLT